MLTYAERKGEELETKRMLSGPEHQPSLRALVEQLVAQVLEDAAAAVESEIGDLRTVTNLLRSMAERRAEIPAALSTASDAAELRWWRSAFATRFPPGELPAPYTALLGRRFHLVDASDPTGRDPGEPRFGCQHRIDTDPPIPG